MQRGRIEQRHGAWHLRYRLNGKQVTRKLADYSDKYRTERSVRPLADEILEPLNAGRQVNGPMTLQQYAEQVYFPNVKEKLKPSTYKGYFNLYAKQIQPRIGGLRLSTFTTADGQRILYAIDNEEELSHQSLLNINSLLSAFFTHARRSGTLSGQNPMDGTEIPKGKRTEKTHKYSLEEVEKMTATLSGVEQVAVVVAAWTGLSLAELRGLRWEDIDFDAESLNVVRTVWHREIIDTKTEHRAASVHLLSNVVAALKKHRKANPSTQWVFEGPRVFPLDLATLGSKRIAPALEGTGVEWHGFHAFRRGLATRLLNNKTDLPTVGRILRHTPGSIVTLKNYAEVQEEMQADALKSLPLKSSAK
jgi:integrase